MKLSDIALLNIRRRKARTAFVGAGLLVGVATLVALFSLTQALTHEINHKLEKYGANILITPHSDQLSLTYEGMNLGGFSFETKEINQADLKGIEGIKNAANVAAMGPMVLGAVELKGSRVLLAGVDLEAADILKPWWQVRGSRPGTGEIMPGSEAARVLGLKPGDGIEAAGRTFKVSGVLAPTGSQDDSLVFARLEDAQATLNKPGLISMVEVAALCKDCPIDDMVSQIAAALPGAKVMAIQSVVKGRKETIQHFQRFSLGMSALVALLGGLVVGVGMMAGVRERTGEIGIFRAIGFRRSHIVRIVLTEALAISLGAGILGALAGYAAGWAALPFLAQSHDASLHLDPVLGLAGVLVAVVLGMLASLYPALTAARMDPHLALRTL